MKIILKKSDFFVLRFDLNEEFLNDEFLNFLNENKVYGGYFFGLGNAQYIKVAYIDINPPTHFNENSNLINNQERSSIMTQSNNNLQDNLKMGVGVNDKKYHSSEFSGSMEISNITGEISLKDPETVSDKTDEINIHTHITFSNEKFESFAGHLEKLIVGGTLEIFLFKIDTLRRKFSPEVGFQILK